jgi:hypothetical protein
VIDSDWDVPDSLPFDPWVALGIAMIGLIVLNAIGIKTSQPCSTDFIQKIVGCKDTAARDRCAMTNTIEGCSPSASKG